MGWQAGVKRGGPTRRANGVTLSGPCTLGFISSLHKSSHTLHPSMDPPFPSIRLCTLSSMRFSQRIPKREFSQYFPRVINCARIEMDGILRNAPSSRLPRPLQLPSPLASFYISPAKRMESTCRYSGRQETAIRGTPFHYIPHPPCS